MTSLLHAFIGAPLETVSFRLPYLEGLLGLVKNSHLSTCNE